MTEKINGIVLNVRAHNERNIIVTLYTRQRGRMAFVSPSGSGKAANVRRARLQPLAVIDADINVKASSELQRLGTIYPSQIWTDIYFHPAKRALALFLSEFLYRLLNAAMPEPQLFDFLVRAFKLLDSLNDHIEDFHIPFLVEMLKFSGISPNIEGWRKGYVFEFESGSFMPEYEAKGPLLRGQEAEAVKWVSRLNFRNMKILKPDNALRRQILYTLLNYFSYHFPGLGNLKSPDILREIFR